MVVTTSLDLESLVDSLNTAQLNWLAKRVRQIKVKRLLAEYEAGKFPPVNKDEIALFHSKCGATAVSYYKVRCVNSEVDFLDTQEIQEIIAFAAGASS